MEILSVACNSTVGDTNTAITSGERIPIIRDVNGMCILKFKDGRNQVIVPESELNFCGFIVDEKATETII